MENRINDSEIGNKYDEILKSSSPITEFKEIPGTNNIRCTLQDGATYVVPVDHTLQSYFDKMEEHPEIDVDFGKNCRDMIEILPFQNKIVLKQRMTGKLLKSLDIDSNLLFRGTHSITGKENDWRLNPAVLAMLEDYPSLRKEYVEATGNINIIYNFAAKAEKSSENRANKHIAKEMNKYYYSEKEYVAEQKAENQMSQKIGYVNMLDKIKSKGQDKLDTTQVVETFEKRKKEFFGEVQKSVQKGVEIGAQSFQPRENSSETRTNPEDKVEFIHE